MDPCYDNLILAVDSMLNVDNIKKSSFPYKERKLLGCRRLKM